jgi:flavin reductase (DIM6/NTAB) family NADH-FMN oxidoreductase RutF
MTKKYINAEELRNLHPNKSIHLINSLGGFKSVALIGTKSEAGNTNLAIFSSIFHLGANPPLVGLIFRPSPPMRDTLKNILENKYYTINHLNEAIYKQAHQTSARYDASLSEFDCTDLTEEYKNDFEAPFVKESNVQIGLIFREKIDIAINKTHMIIGEIVQIYFPEACQAPDGFVDLEKANSITCSGLDSYHKTTKLDRLSYAKPNLPITSI